MGNAVHGKKTKILFGADDISRWFNEVDISGEVELVDTTTFDQTDKSYLIGYRDGKASLKGIFKAKDTGLAPNEIDDILQPILGVESEQIVTIGQMGMAAVGDVVSMLKTKLPKYSVQSPVNNLVSIMAELQSVKGIRTGRLLAPLTARTTTGTGASVDNGAASSNGAHFHLHCLAASASDTLDVVVEDSADGSSWATLATFTQVAAVGVQRSEVAGTVRRYTRVTWSIAGTATSFTFAVAQARL